MSLDNLACLGGLGGGAVSQWTGCQWIGRAKIEQGEPLADLVDVPVGVGEVLAVRAALRLVRSIVGGQPQLQFDFSAGRCLGPPDAGHALAVVDARVEPGP